MNFPTASLKLSFTSYCKNRLFIASLNKREKMLVAKKRSGKFQTKQKDNLLAENYN